MCSTFTSLRQQLRWQLDSHRWQVTYFDTGNCGLSRVDLKWRGKMFVLIHHSVNHFCSFQHRLCHQRNYKTMSERLIKSRTVKYLYSFMRVISELPRTHWLGRRMLRVERRSWYMHGRHLDQKNRRLILLCFAEGLVGWWRWHWCDCCITDKTDSNVEGDDGNTWWWW
jgi:hypothetical protein